MADTKKPLGQRMLSAWNELTGRGEQSEEIIITRGRVKPPEAFVGAAFGGTSRVLFAGSFNGEKNTGELGPIKYFMLDYAALALRSWQAYIESTEAKTIIDKYCTWVIGKGLKLQAEPVQSVIGKTGIDFKKFSKDVESRWQVYANSMMADYSGRQTLNQLAKEAYKNAIVSGDCLVILRYEECLTVQLVDSNHIGSPMLGSEWFPFVMKNGNRIINGVEINEKGEHIAYFVRKPFTSVSPLSTLAWERVPVKTDQGLTNAFLLYGSKFRVDTHRGMALLAAVLERLKKMERYEEATLGAAEELSKIAYQIVHQMGSTGENPLAKSIARAHNVDGFVDLPTDDAGRELANTVAASTNKTVVNNPVNAEIKPMREAKGQLYFQDFLDKNIDLVCASVEMPPNIAMSKYDSNYSAARAAIKDWEHTLGIKRIEFAVQFYQRIYNVWLEFQIRELEIQAAGYLLAVKKNRWMVLEAFRTARWIGAPVPNIDPVKEATAERLKLGITGESMPLTTHEESVEALGGGDSGHIMEQYADELEESKKLGIKPEPEVKQTSVVTDK
jgi:capsid protein